MRNSLTLLFTAFLLGACLSAEESAAPRVAESTIPPETNEKPTIGGNPPPAVLYGEMYDFEPEANDSDGDSLSFTIKNKPNWAQFDDLSGRLFGQPSLASVGTYEDVEITVTDSKAEVSLRAFSITVSEHALGTITLSWLPPTANSDGSPLRDLAGYRLYYGRSSREYDHEIHIVNPGVTDYVVENLVADEYYFSATAVNASGVESEFSAESVRVVEF